MSSSVTNRTRPLTSPARIGPVAAGDARARIVDTAYDLFSVYGLRAVGIDRIVAESGVAKTTLYHHFRSKEELVLAVLERRDELWTKGWLETAVEAAGGTAAERLLRVFDVFDEWFRRDDYEGCLFANSLLESRWGSAQVRAASGERLAEVRTYLQRLAEEAGIRGADNFARQWQILLLGAVVAAFGGDHDAALRARSAASLLLAGALAG
jgi:AcrR family transcriptional regulator